MKSKSFELERKFFVKDPKTFWRMVQEVSDSHRLDKYGIGEQSHKNRVYRYFDTFEGSLRDQQGVYAIYAHGESEFPLISDLQRELSPRGVLEELGASISTRERQELADCVLTIKMPTDDPLVRGDYDYPLPNPTDFYNVDPNQLDISPHLEQIRRRTKGKPLQEVIRLYIQTHRFSLHPYKIQKNERILEIALDSIVGMSLHGSYVVFSELEIERKGQGNKTEVNVMNDYFMNRYGNHLVESSLPKWIKAMRLIRGEEIIPNA